jgi:glycolate oxidase subunit GlcD
MTTPGDPVLAPRPASQHRTTDQTRLEHDLERLLGKDSIVPLQLAHEYLHDSTEMQSLRGRADAVAMPANTEQVAELVTWCYERGVPIVPRGGGTGFAGGAVPIDGGVVCSLERLNRIRQFQPELWRMEVDAGVVTSRVHRLARQNGLLFPPDPGASEQSQIGGNIACNAGGPHAFKYGVTGKWVTGIEAVLASGTVTQLGGSLRKDVAGYDLRSLLIGSEGTLGIITGAWLRLTPAPELAIPIVAGYEDVSRGVHAVADIFASGLCPAAIEFFDSNTLSATRGSFPGGIPGNTNFMLVVEADGPALEARNLSDQLSDVLGSGATFVSVIQNTEVASLWRWRAGTSFAVYAQLGGKMSEDIAFPVEQLEAAILMVQEVGEQHGLRSCSWGHAGDANLHATFMFDAASASQVARARDASQDLFARTLALGGTVSGEHGLGWVKREQFDLQFPAEVASLQRHIKQAFDPKNLFNPGKKLTLSPDSPLGVR